VALIAVPPLAAVALLLVGLRTTNLLWVYASVGVGLISTPLFVLGLVVLVRNLRLSRGRAG
jgi:hypothetical protein